MEIVFLVVFGGLGGAFEAVDCLDQRVIFIHARGYVRVTSPFVVVFCVRCVGSPWSSPSKS